MGMVALLPRKNVSGTIDLFVIDRRKDLGSLDSVALSTFGTGVKPRFFSITSSLIVTAE
jgi:hypothetical protein